MRLIIAVLDIAGQVVYVAWVASGVGILIAQQMGAEPRDILRDLYHELRPFYWAAVIAMHIDPITKGGAPAYLLNWVHYLGWGGHVWIWLVYKDIDDDDRWKRRRKKLAEAVKRVGDRLVVTFPEPVMAR